MPDGARAVGFSDRVGQKPKILLVDDSPGLRLMVSLCLRGLGFEIVVAATGEAAMAIVEREAIDLVFSDVSAGSTINGLRFIDWLFERRPELPFLLTSSDAKKAHEARILHPQATLFAKPYDIDQVAENVCRLIARVSKTVESVPAE